MYTCKIKRSLFLLLTAVTLVEAGPVVVPNDENYYISNVGDTELIYTEKNKKFAEQAASLEAVIHSEYEELFGYEMDQVLHVGLISDNNQIANGFSTQVPFNMQINYLGGTQLIDYFSTTSWLNTLLYHETAHNYQINAKKSVISKTGYEIFGNTGFTFFFLPFFTIPNAMESSYLLEGNAVLNESWHDNGGRLYSGRFLALTYMQSQAGSITPSLMYNPTLNFPYGERYYIIGGFFQLYLAERFGLKKTNEYFYNHSGSWSWPFRTNHIFNITFGISFEKALADFDEYLTKKRRGFSMAMGEYITSSQVFYQLNSDKDEIFFLANDAFVSSADLVHFDKKTKKVEFTSGSWYPSKLIKKEGEYLSQSSAHTNPTKIYQGLFGKNGFIENGSESKMVQGYLKDLTPVYFDVASSYDAPQLYIGSTFYDSVNSSVYIDDDDNIYYFKQESKTRTLYKNREPLFSFSGYYGYVNDIDSNGGIYFIANSDKGSTLYRYKDATVSRAHSADNIVEARLVDDETLLIAAIGEDEYYYITCKSQMIDEKPFNTTLFFEDKAYFASASLEKQEKVSLDLSESYIAPLDMHFSAIHPSIGYSNTKGVLFSVNASYADTLIQNSFSLFAERNINEVALAGASYVNTRYILEFGASVYGVIDSNEGNRSYVDLNGTSHEIDVDNRHYGVASFARLPLIDMGYISSDLSASYYMDYDSQSREPASLALDLTHLEAFGRSMYYNFESRLLGYGVYDREDMIYGGSYDFSHSLPAEFYIGFGLKYSASDASAETNSNLYDRGVKVTAFQSAVVQDPSTIVMPAISSTTYVKEVGYAEVNLKKVINLSAYFFTFPFSLRRESIYSSYRYYELENFTDEAQGVDEELIGTIKVHEAQVGITFETVLLNKLVLPISVGYLYNDSVVNEHQFTLGLGLGF